MKSGMKKRTLIITSLGLLVGAASLYTQQTTSLFDPLINNSVIEEPAVAVAEDSPFESPSVLGEVSDARLETDKASPESAISRPRRLEIPKLGVAAMIEHVGLDENQRMDVPVVDENVAWYQYGPVPGELGSSVLAGHFDTKTGGPAVFYELTELEPGDKIMVEDERGREQTFVVTKIRTHQDHNFPIAEVFGDTSGKKLNLITCAGQFDQAAKNYQDRLVVYSELQE